MRNYLQRNLINITDQLRQIIKNNQLLFRMEIQKSKL